MPAYFQSIPGPPVCQKDGCYKQATHRVNNSYNSEVGQFCRKHAAEKVAELNVWVREAK